MSIQNQSETVSDIITADNEVSYASKLKVNKHIMHDFSIESCVKEMLPKISISVANKPNQSSTIPKTPNRSRGGGRWGVWF